MALNTITKRNVHSYVQKKIVSTGTITEIRDLLLFFNLIQVDQDYCKLAGLTNRIYEIHGFEQAAEGVFRLDHHFGRRFRFSFGCVGRRINFDDQEVVDYLFERIEREMRKKLIKLSPAYRCRLAIGYPVILADLLNGLRQVQLYDNKARLENLQIRAIIKKRLKKSVNNKLIEALTTEFLANQRTLKEVYSLQASADSITEQRRYFESLMALSSDSESTRIDDMISQTLNRARQSRFIKKGADYHMRPGIYAAIITQIIVLVASLLLTAALQWGFPLIPLIGASGPFMALVSTALFTLLQFPMFTSLYPFIMHRHEKVDNVTKDQLVRRLGKAVPMYQAQLNKNGFDLGKFGEGAFIIDPHMRREPAVMALFGRHRRNPSTGEGIVEDDLVSIGSESSDSDHSANEAELLVGRA